MILANLVLSSISSHPSKVLFSWCPLSTTTATNETQCLVGGHFWLSQSLFIPLQPPQPPTRQDVLLVVVLSSPGPLSFTMATNETWCLVGGPSLSLSGPSWTTRTTNEPLCLVGGHSWLSPSLFNINITLRRILFHGGIRFEWCSALHLAVEWHNYRGAFGFVSYKFWFLPPMRYR